MDEETPKVKTSTRLLVMMFVTAIFGLVFRLLNIPEAAGFAGIVCGIIGIAAFTSLLYEVWQGRSAK